MPAVSLGDVEQFVLSTLLCSGSDSSILMYKLAFQQRLCSANRVLATPVMPLPMYMYYMYDVWL